MHARSADDLFGHIQFNNIGLVNDLLSHAQCAQLHRRKWFSPKNGLKSLTRSLPLCHWPYFTGFASPHLAVAYERKTFEQLWAAAPETLEATCRHRFRSMTDVSQLAARAWRLAQGQFTPAKPLGRPYFPDEVDGVQLAINAITRRYFRMICVNDEDRGFDFERERRRLIAAFETLLPQQSAFERCAPGQKEERP